jgi:hypothetical protein
MSTQEQYAPPEDILSDVLTALCHAVARAIELIPPDRPEYRRQACTYALRARGSRSPSFVRALRRPPWMALLKSAHTSIAVIFDALGTTGWLGR